MHPSTPGYPSPSGPRRLTHSLQPLARPLAALGLLLATAGAAQAQTPGPVIYAAYPGLQTYTVPPGVMALRVEARGASSGEGYAGAVSGKGALVQATVAVVPGEVLTIAVGIQGANSSSGSSAGGYNGGGAGGFFAGSGGGATDLRRTYNPAVPATRTADYLQSRNALVVAGGGGGAGASNGAGAGNGGAGGTPTGGDGSNTPTNATGATQTGVGSSGSAAGAATTSTGGAGALGSGTFVGGGGGGGGYYGGGGGGIGGSGGGGSSWVALTGSNNISYQVSGTATGGTLMLTPVTAAPFVSTTSPATNIGTTSATVGGTNTAYSGTALTSYGVVYVVGTGTPTLTNKTGQVVAGTSAPASFPSAFSAGLTGLLASTQYTAAAYATNNVGTTYGSPVTFTTTATLAALPGTELAQVQASLYPTPAASTPLLSFTGLPAAVATVQVAVLDELGRAVGYYSLTAHAGSARQRVATDQLAGSLYLLRLTALDAQGQVLGQLPTQRLTLTH